VGRLAVDYRLMIVLVAVSILGAVSVNDFVAFDTFQSVLNRATIVGLLALGLTPVLIARQIDLSVGSTLSMAGISTVMLQPMVGNVPAALLGLLVGVLIGAVNAAIVVWLRVSSLVTTLATLLIFASLALLLTGSRPVSSPDPRFGLGLTSELFVIFSPRSLLFVLAVVAMFVWLRYTPSGRRLYAVGSNPPAAASAGVNTNAYIASTFLISGLCSGAAGVIQALSTATGSPVAGAAMLIPAITAVVIGGTRLEGGRGSALATLGGVVALGALTAVLEFNGVPSYTQAIYTGLLLILLITLDRLVDGGGRKAVRTHGKTRAEVIPNPAVTRRKS
jgi:ribose transport system permease protein